MYYDLIKPPLSFPTCTMPLPCLYHCLVHTYHFPHLFRACIELAYLYSTSLLNDALHLHARTHPISISRQFF